MNEELRELYQQVILDHSRHPRNHGRMTGNCIHVHGNNPSCGDELDLYVRITPGGEIEEIKFEGQGCAISQASASLLTVKAKGKPTGKALLLVEDFLAVVTGVGQANNPDDLGELQFLAGIQQFPQRVKCAMLGFRALEEAIRRAGEMRVRPE